MRGTTGIVAGADVTLLNWIERPGTLLQFMSSELDESAVLNLAEGGRSTDKKEWNLLYATAERHSSHGRTSCPPRASRRPR